MAPWWHQLTARPVKVGLLVLWLDDTWLGWRWGDVHFGPRLHAICSLGDVLLVRAFGRVRTVGIHHPLRRDLLGHQLCLWQQAFPKRMDGLRAPAIGVPTTDGGEVQVRVVRHH